MTANIAQAILWSLRMSWRQSRASRTHFIPYTIALGIALYALCITSSLGGFFQNQLDTQARALLGADISVESRDGELPLGGANLPQGATIRREISFRSMIGTTSGSRLMQIRAIEDGFPFYGNFVVEPPTAVREMQSNGGIVLDQAVMDRLGLRTGDIVSLGKSSLNVRGALLGLPGESPAATAILPRALIRYEDLDQTGLRTFGSVLDYRAYLKLPEGEDPDAVANRLRARPELRNTEVRTVTDRKAMLSNIFDSVSQFFDVLSLSLLILVGVAVGATVRFYLAQQRNTIAALRCIGAPTGLLLLSYLFQLFALSMLACIFAILAAKISLSGLVLLLRGYLPFGVSEVTANTIASGEMFVLSAVTSLLLPLPALLDMLQVTPLDALRPNITHRSSLRNKVIVLLILGLLAFCYLFFHTQSLRQSLILSAALALLIGIFSALSFGVKRLARRAMGSRIPYVMRLGFSNLHRPGNNTAVLLAALGFGAFVILTVLLCDATIRGRAAFLQDQNKPNYVLFDIQPAQLPALRALASQTNVENIQEAPVVLMRLRSVDGKATASLEQDGNTPRWTLRREYWATYRDQLIDNEEIIRGAWVSNASGREPIPISIEKGLADKLHVDLGSPLVFNVHGREMRTQVASIREVYWQQMRRNAFIVFPDGVLNDAPQFHVMMARIGEAKDIARFERLLAEQLPNITGLDLRYVVATVSGILDTVSSTLLCLAGVILLTGILVLISSLLSSHFLRAQEQAFLRIVGASDRALQRIYLSEQLSLALIGTAAGIACALGASGTLAHFVFKAPLIVPWKATGAATLLLVTTVVTVAHLSTRRVSRTSPLETLQHS